MSGLFKTMSANAKAKDLLLFMRRDLVMAKYLCLLLRKRRLGKMSTVLVPVYTDAQRKQRAYLSSLLCSRMKDTHLNLAFYSEFE